MTTAARQLMHRTLSSGFSLIGLVICIALVAATMAVGFFGIGGSCRGTLKQDKARMDMGTLMQGLDLCKARLGKYPDVNAGLRELVVQNCLKEVPEDPWAREYIYRSENGRPVVLTYGEDGQPGGEGVDEDLSSLGGHR